ncbi:HGL311Wp [Eremothecium sinecaudum]|uniref:HGL311Wp n=1 Tax=Eremothecium sinecaudum TaxID=45286 RepID=A0A0X8HV75_9SACH|nr:HGL311Wp [Eremothecium sinecaudum]AMD22029.1 HGL311Wp [Eremothecium sinecaudum]
MHMTNTITGSSLFLCPLILIASDFMVSMHAGRASREKLISSTAAIRLNNYSRKGHQQGSAQASNRLTNSKPTRSFLISRIYRQ